MKVLTSTQLEELELIRELLNHSDYSKPTHKNFYREQAVGKIFDFTHRNRASILGEEL